MIDVLDLIDHTAQKNGGNKNWYSVNREHVNGESENKSEHQEYNYWRVEGTVVLHAKQRGNDQNDFRHVHFQEQEDQIDYMIDLFYKQVKSMLDVFPANIWKNRTICGTVKYFIYFLLTSQFC